LAGIAGGICLACPFERRSGVRASHFLGALHLRWRGLAMQLRRSRLCGGRLTCTAWRRVRRQLFELPLGLGNVRGARAGPRRCYLAEESDGRDGCDD